MFFTIWLANCVVFLGGDEVILVLGPVMWMMSLLFVGSYSALYVRGTKGCCSSSLDACALLLYSGGHMYVVHVASGWMMITVRRGHGGVSRGRRGGGGVGLTIELALCLAESGMATVVSFDVASLVFTLTVECVCCFDPLERCAVDDVNFTYVQMCCEFSVLSAGS